MRADSIYSAFTQPGAAFPLACQINQDYEVQRLQIAFGRMYDSTSININVATGVRIYKGRFADAGWHTSYDLKGAQPIWCAPCDGGTALLWGEKLQFLVEFYGTAATGAHFEFVVRAE